MHISGFIPTNIQPGVNDISAQCKEKGVEYELGVENFKVNTTRPIGSQKITIGLWIMPNGIKYKTFIPELSGYVFISVVAVLVLFRVIPTGIWSVLLLFVPVLLIGIKIYYDKQIFSFVDSIIPESLKLVPELATKEHINWINNPDLCPGCGAQRNKYLDKCQSCGLSLDKIREKPDNRSQTSTAEINVTYKKEK
jgi:hypothetical protein